MMCQLFKLSKKRRTFLTLSQLNLLPEAITPLTGASWDRVIRKSGAVPRGWEEDSHYQVVR